MSEHKDSILIVILDHIAHRYGDDFAEKIFKKLPKDIQYKIAEHASVILPFLDVVAIALKSKARETPKLTVIQTAITSMIEGISDASKDLKRDGYTPSTQEVSQKAQPVIKEATNTFKKMGKQGLFNAKPADFDAISKWIDKISKKDPLLGVRAYALLSTLEPKHISNLASVPDSKKTAILNSAFPEEEKLEDGFGFWKWLDGFKNEFAQIAESLTDFNDERAFISAVELDKNKKRIDAECKARKASNKTYWTGIRWFCVPFVGWAILLFINLHGFVVGRLLRRRTEKSTRQYEKERQRARERRVAR